MANAKEEISRVVKEEGGFQNDPNDSGNIYQGVNYGTKFGITPGAWVAYYGKGIQPDTIKTLTVEKVVPIYKKNFWDKFRGDEIENSSVAALMMFTVVNSGVGQCLTFKKIINFLSGKKVVAETKDPLTSAEVKILNSLDQERFFTTLRDFRIGFYKSLAAADPAKAKYLKGWLNRLNQHVFVPEKKSLITNASIMLILIFIFWFIFLR